MKEPQHNVPTNLTPKLIPMTLLITLSSFTLQRYSGEKMVT
jgi:hypothetical protein